jgi:hypothetical protein
MRPTEFVSRAVSSGRSNEIEAAQWMMLVTRERTSSRSDVPSARPSTETSPVTTSTRAMPGGGSS